MEETDVSLSVNISGIQIYIKCNFPTVRSVRLIVFFLSLYFGDVGAQELYPADTLLKSENVSLFRKIAITPMALWQRISYSEAAYNCQFYPSCSNYGALSIARHGTVTGMALMADRVIRCNPFAHGYHIRSTDSLFHSDGRLVNLVPVRLFEQKREERSPLLASALSAAIPGVGRIYAGRKWDGLFGFLTVTALANITNRHHRLKREGGTLFFGGLTLSFYVGEIIGAYRGAAVNKQL
ncbi:MAG: hypothetical protein CMG71_01615 [Candidatus Marinimicrobia bacterium]|nr:hypothetical protein [Candidatus Neomarinimicrobiota bacterium]|tara:strand:+ start:3432 stop:4145 length:714 start_codon:yes stop_codon:yes gene_type:complete